MFIGRMIFAVVVGSSLVLAGAPGQFSAPTASAARFQANPAPYSNFRQMISPTALLGLSRQHAGPQAQQSTGDNGNPLIALLHPHKPVATALGDGGQGAGQGTGPAGPQGGINAVPPGSIVFNNDPSAIEQNETSVTVRQMSAAQNTTLTQTGTAAPMIDALSANSNPGQDQVVGGVNDSRGFYYTPSLGCTPNYGQYCYPARNCVSLSGFSVSLSGGQQLDKSGCLPWVNKTFQPFGDPALDRDAAGNVYYGSLGFDQTAGSGQNGIILERSTPALFDPGTPFPCQNVSGPPGSGIDNSNQCWRGQVVSIGDVNPNPTTGACDLAFCTFADKDWVAVDRYSTTQYRGDVYVDWNSGNVVSGTAHILLSRCHPDDASPTGFSSCTAPVVISNPADQFTGGGSYLTVTRDGYVLAVYANFGTPTTLYPIDYRVSIVAPGGQTVLGYTTVAHITQNGDRMTTPCLPNTDPPSNSGYGAPCKDNMGFGALAGVTMRAPEFVKIDVDRSTGPTKNTVYTTFELCTLPQFIALTDGNGNIIYPGNCPKTDVFVARFHLGIANGTVSASASQYLDLTRQAPGQQFFPSVTVDDQSGAAVVTYNSTQDDPFQNMDSVYAQASFDGGISYRPLSSTVGGRVTSFSYQITKDPAGYFGQGFPSCGPPGSLPNATGCPGYAPENGDYLQSMAFRGHLYTHYAGTYLQKAFTPSNTLDLGSFFDGSLPMNQYDNYLARNEVFHN